MENTAQTVMEQVVKKQLDAYNSKDIDLFMTCWADDALYYEFPDTLLASGAAAIRERHLVRFQEPNLFGKLISRTVLHNKVVDFELVSRTFPDGPGYIDALCIYEVAGDKITKAWFVMGTPIRDTAT
ncbi:nuclear transport factor 2 family protein [Mucilaginibacter sp. KACC 22773]|uniref:nuclear transport factor 2 family protein n=1 Tax=Mucilaginibacter sp. KACC 22773 TaxID=3025671 RepID=UPI002365711A|nr:nuclear transport factor 2 family protein [Mucilaginibacter sp. KACC 22773]WDF79369.1 nuclear transport factor 2 family protein [Mucilaginibacter sp. KACC 22773]